MCGARQIEFVRLLGHEPLEFNQEQARVMAYDGKASIIRSFPCVATQALYLLRTTAYRTPLAPHRSKVGVSSQPLRSNSGARISTFAPPPGGGASARRAPRCPLPDR